MIHISFKGIDPRAVHLAFVLYTLRKETKDIAGGRNVLIPPEPLGSFRMKAPLDKHERKEVRKLLRYTHGDTLWSNKQLYPAIPLNTFLKFCKIIDTDPLQLFTRPVTWIRKENNGKDIPLELSKFI